MARRIPSSPPVLPGFSYLHILGSGGFADVFLYEQNMPRRHVAVKVMLSEIVNDQVRQMFQAEVNLMAQLSAHPAVLTVYEANVAGDGRPYLVMELCSPALNERYRRERIPVPEVVRIAVKVGSAIETAHRAGVLHRDLKPSNILLTSYGHPVLSDFGIASTLSAVRDAEQIGLSIPWSAPEVLLDETPGTIASEVWSFAATIYSLLAGRSPFEIPGGDNSAAELVGRISRAKPQPLSRPDAPASLERALRRAMSRRPEQRHESVLEFVRELQSVESELGLPQTPAELATDDWSFGTVADLEERTRLRPVATASASSRGSRRRARAAVAAPIAVTAPGRGTPSRPSGPAPRQARAGWLLGATALVLVLGATVLAVLVSSLRDDGIPVVRDITARVQDGAVEFEWRDPGRQSGDRYLIETADGSQSTQTSPRFVVDAEPGERVCVTVTVTRAGQLGSPSAQKCVDIPEA